MRFTSVLPTASLHAAASRRRFMQALVAGGALGAIGDVPAWSQVALPAARTGTPSELRGPSFDLTLAETSVNFDGRRGIATTINGSLPGFVRQAELTGQRRRAVEPFLSGTRA